MVNTYPVVVSMMVAAPSNPPPFSLVTSILRRKVKDVSNRVGRSSRRVERFCHLAPLTQRYGCRNYPNGLSLLSPFRPTSLLRLRLPHALIEVGQRPAPPPSCVYVFPRQCLPLLTRCGFNPFLIMLLWTSSSATDKKHSCESAQSNSVEYLQNG